MAVPFQRRDPEVVDDAVCKPLQPAAKPVHLQPADPTLRECTPATAVRVGSGRHGMPAGSRQGSTMDGLMAFHSASPNGRQIAGLPATVRADGMRWERTGAAVYADMRYCSDPYSTSYSPSTDLGPSTPSRSRLVTVVLQSGAHGRTASAPSASVRESAASFDGLKESRWMEWQFVARRACER